MFLSISLVDGIREGFKIAVGKSYHVDMLKKEAAPLMPGSSFGPFTLSVIERPKKNVFMIDSYFFKGKTGYFLSVNGKNTTLHFDTFPDDLNMMQKIWWGLFRPVHMVLANLVLRNIKKGIEIA